MTDYILIFPILISFLISFIFLPVWIEKARRIGLVWEDMNKLAKQRVSGSGGIITLLGFLIGVLSFIAYRTFYLKVDMYLIEILSLLLVVVLASGIGFIDDLLGWRSGGLSRKSRLILLFMVAIPLMAINAGKNTIELPVLGHISLGILYPLIFIPVGVMGATATFNFLAGYNGLEAGQGIIIISALGVVAFFTGNSWLTVIAFCMVAVLLAFLFYNYCPARVFPGDVLTYAVGSLIAIISILGNFEKIAVFFFIPYIIETILKSRGRLTKYSFGKPQKDGTINLPYDKIYGLEHISIKILQTLGLRSTERNVVHLLWGFQILIIILGFLIFKRGIFGA